MPKRGPSGAALLALLWLAAPAISRPAAAAERPLEVMHSWISGSERAAIDIVRAEFERRGGRWIDSALADEYAVHRVLADRLMTDTGSTAVKWRGGSLRLGEDFGWLQVPGTEKLLSIADRDVASGAGAGQVGGGKGARPRTFRTLSMNCRALAAQV